MSLPREPDCSPLSPIFGVSSKVQTLSDVLSLMSAQECKLSQTFP